MCLHFSDQVNYLVLKLNKRSKLKWKTKKENLKNSASLVIKL